MTFRWRCRHRCLSSLVRDFKLYARTTATATTTPQNDRFNEELVIDENVRKRAKSWTTVRPLPKNEELQQCEMTKFKVLWRTGAHEREF